MIKNFEMSIFDGKYPTSISSDYLEDLESSGKTTRKLLEKNLTKRSQYLLLESQLHLRSQHTDLFH
jgi:hypothetical protein